MNALACRLWELHQVTARLRVRTILEATALLKRKYRQNPHGELAVAIALHYWLLAMRADNGEPYASSQGQISLAARCRDTACRWLRLASQNICQTPVGRQPLIRQANRR